VVFLKKINGFGGLVLGASVVFLLIDTVSRLADRWIIIILPA